MTIHDTDTRVFVCLNHRVGMFYINPKMAKRRETEYARMMETPKKKKNKEDTP